MKKYVIFLVVLLIIIFPVKTLSSKDNEINIIYPSTEYTVVNKKINNYIKKQIKEFDTTKTYLSSASYYLYGKYNETSYKNITSYIIFTEMYLGGAHPTHNLWTISNIKNQIITIDTLIKYNPNILNILSKETYQILSNNKLFKEDTILEMLKEGTKPTKNNFKNFMFSKEGLIVYFERYQIAPYYYGDYHVVIPYDKLK